MIENCNILKEDEFDPQKYQQGLIKILIAQDKGSHHFRIENKSGHYLLKLRLIERQNNRMCDYLILNCSEKKAFFVELKGQNLSDAVMQIQSTLKTLSPRLSAFKFFARIVQTRVIRSTNQLDKESLIKYLKEKHKSNIEGKITDLVKIGSEKLIETI